MIGIPLTASVEFGYPYQFPLQLVLLHEELELPVPVNNHVTHSDVEQMPMHVSKKRNLLGSVDPTMESDKLRTTR